jgi:lysophospholipase L1-like esterase
MNKEKVISPAIRLFVLLAVSVITASLIFSNLNSEPSPDAIRVACVGDSLTQSTIYPIDLEKQLGRRDYIVNNYGAGSTTVSLDSETPYMNTSAFQSALEFQPDIVIIMLGTNDAQPSLHQYNMSFVDDYLTLVAEFQKLSSEPEIWIVLPPPIFSDQGGKISPEYFANTLIPCIEQVANEANLPTIDVYSALASYSDYFSDGIHPNTEGAKLIATEIYEAVKP